MSERWEFELWQDEIQVAGGEGPDQDSMRREAFHYAAQYAQDGPCRLVFKHVTEELEIAGPVGPGCEVRAPRQKPLKPQRPRKRLGAGRVC